MLKTAILTLIFMSLLIPANAKATEKYLSLAKSQSTCENHVLYKNRKVEILDKSGNKTELDRIEFKPEGRYYFRFGFPPCGSTFYVLKDIVQLSIPLNVIEHIKFDDSTCEVKYSFMNKTRTVTGAFLKGSFIGEGDLGTFTIKADKVKRIIFPEPAPAIPSANLNAELILKNGSSIPVREADMETVDLFKSKYQDSFYYNVYHEDTFVSYSPEVKFKKGESYLSVPFNKISRLDVNTEDGRLNLTSKAGKNTAGKFLAKDELKEGTIDGFRGICDEGGFFIAIEHIKEYRFSK